jgi:lysophospholipase L1-like esterase
MVYKIITTSKGKDNLIYRRFTHRKGYTTVSGVVTWRCNSKDCSATVKISDSGAFLSSVGTHNHPAPVGEANSAKSPICCQSDNSLAYSLPSKSDLSNGETSTNTEDESLNHIENHNSDLSVDGNSRSSVDNLEHSLDYLIEENKRLKDKNESLNIQWEAAIDRSIDLDRRIMEIENTLHVDACVQTDITAAISSPRNNILTVDVAVQSEFEAATGNENSFCWIDDRSGYYSVENRLLLREKTIGILNENNNKLIEEVESLEMQLEEMKERLSNLTKQLDFRGIESLGCSWLKNRNCLPESSHLKYKTVLYSDSHGRNMSDLLRVKLPPGGEVQSFVSPGAPLEYIIDSLLSSDDLSQLGNLDWVVVFGGTNSVGPNFDENKKAVFLNKLLNLVSSTKHVNLILCTIPYRYDLRENSRQNFEIKLLNRCIRALCEMCNIKLIDLWLYNRRCHTQHGLHFNKLGKFSFAKDILKLIKSHENSIIVDCLPVEPSSALGLTGCSGGEVFSLSGSDRASAENGFDLVNGSVSFSDGIFWHALDRTTSSVSTPGFDNQNQVQGELQREFCDGIEKCPIVSSSIEKGLCFLAANSLAAEVI